jgi:hypothetical protein
MPVPYKSRILNYFAAYFLNFEFFCNQKVPKVPTNGNRALAVAVLLHDSSSRSRTNSCGVSFPTDGKAATVANQNNDHVFDSNQ